MVLNEVTVVELYGQNNGGDKIRYACASGVAISKGTILDLSDPRTVVASVSSQAATAGIAAMDKEADDLSTSISVYQNGVFKMVASESITAGANVKSYGEENVVLNVGIEAASFGVTIGKALEDASAGETINVRVNI